MFERGTHSSWPGTQLGSISFTTSVAFSIFKIMSLSYLEKRPLLLKLREERRRRSRDTPDKQNALSWLAELHVRYSASPVQFSKFQLFQVPIGPSNLKLDRNCILGKRLTLWSENICRNSNALSTFWLGVTRATAPTSFIRSIFSLKKNNNIDTWIHERFTHLHEQCVEIHVKKYFLVFRRLL